MKRTPLLFLIPMILCVALLLPSCGREHISSLDEIMQEEPSYRSTVLSESVVALPELEGYTMQNVNPELAVFVRKGENGLNTYKVLSLRLKRVIRTLEESSSRYSISLVGNTSAFFVNKTVYNFSLENSSGLEEIVREEYHLYDTTEAVIAISLRETHPVLFADLLIFDGIAYSFDDRGALIPTFNVPEYVKVESCTDWTDQYFYSVDERDVTVYDRSMRSVFYWEAPSYAIGPRIFVMNDGNLVAQYYKQLPDDAEEYDLLTEDANGGLLKRDLVTLTMSIEDQKISAIDAEYRIMSVDSYRTFLRGEGDTENILPFDNMAIIAPIIEKRVDITSSTLDLVLMNNIGEKTSSLRFVPMQMAVLPVAVGNGIYVVDLHTGEKALIDASGTVRHHLTGEYRFVDGQMVGDRGIYRLTDMAPVLDFRQSGATVTAVIDNTVFITEKNDDGYTVYTVRGSSKEVLYTVGKDTPITDTTVLRILEEGRCYEIYSVTAGEYKYYNSEGKLMLTTTMPLDDDFTVSDYGILARATDGIRDQYYIFTDGVASSVAN